MKRLLLIVLPLLLIVGCSKPLDDDTLLDRNGIKYEQNKQEPYNGRVFSLHPSGKKKLDGNYKNGKKIGVWTIFYDNDKNNKFKENIYENGKLSGLVEWYDNGHKKYEGSIDKYGKKLGHWIKWYENDDEAIMAFMDMLDQLGDENYGMIRLGEESDDVGYYGCPSSFDMYVERNIQW